MLGGGGGGGGGVLSMTTAFPSHRAIEIELFKA